MLQSGTFAFLKLACGRTSIAGAGTQAGYMPCRKQTKSVGSCVFKKRAATLLDELPKYRVSVGASVPLIKILKQRDVKSKKKRF